MSREAMRDAAVYAASGKIPPGSALGCLTWLAYFTYDSQPPYRSYASPRTLETLLNLQPRQVREIIEYLKGLGVLDTTERDEKDRRRKVLTLHLPEHAPAEYTAIFAPPESRQYIAYVDLETGDTAPRNIGDTAPGQEEYRRYSAADIGDTAPRYRRYSAVSTYKEKYEKREEKEEETITPPYDNLARQRNAEADAEETPSPLPPSPTPAGATWRHMREALRDEISESQAIAWLRKIQPSWLPDGALLLLAHSTYAAEMITMRYSERLLLAAERVVGHPVDIEIRAGRMEANA